MNLETKPYGSQKHARSKTTYYTSEDSQREKTTRMSFKKIKTYDAYFFVMATQMD